MALHRAGEGLIPAEDGIHNGQRLFSAGIGLLFVACVPGIHIGIIQRIWTPNKKPVDKASCKCSCWDTIFKGSYEYPVAGYKHIYFNATANTMVVWVITILVFITAYECLRHLAQLFSKGQLRVSMCLLFLLDIYPHYYSWWMYFNAFNDEFYDQLYHQFFFSFTELISSGFVLYTCNADRQPNPIHLVVIAGIAILHILASGVDQFIANVLFGKGAGFQVFRDLSFMVADLLHVFIPLWLFYTTQKRISLKQVLKQKEVLFTFSVLVLWFFTLRFF